MCITTELSGVAAQTEETMCQEPTAATSGSNDGLAVAGNFKRDCDGAPCPHCNGYADRVDATKEEVKQYQTCGRSYACCIDAFVCRVCGKRFIGTLEAPECG